MSQLNGAAQLIPGIHDTRSLAYKGGPTHINSLDKSASYLSVD